MSHWKKSSSVTHSPRWIAEKIFQYIETPSRSQVEIFKGAVSGFFPERKSWKYSKTKENFNTKESDLSADITRPIPKLELSWSSCHTRIFSTQWDPNKEKIPIEIKIRESFNREIFSMNRVVARNVLSRRFLRYEVTKNHYDALHVRQQILQKGKK